jgi:hypothetical protein
MTHPLTAGGHLSASGARHVYKQFIQELDGGEDVEAAPFAQVLANGASEGTRTLRRRAERRLYRPSLVDTAP